MNTTAINFLRTGYLVRAVETRQGWQMGRVFVRQRGRGEAEYFHRSHWWPLDVAYLARVQWNRSP